MSKTHLDSSSECTGLFVFSEMIGIYSILAMPFYVPRFFAIIVAWAFVFRL